MPTRTGRCTPLAASLPPPPPPAAAAGGARPAAARTQRTCVTGTVRPARSPRACLPPPTAEARGATLWRRRACRGRTRLRAPAGPGECWPREPLLARGCAAAGALVPLTAGFVGRVDSGISTSPWTCARVACWWTVAVALKGFLAVGAAGSSTHYFRHSEYFPSC
jgi:hypothetical protein